MLDTKLVLLGQAAGYTAYVLAIMALMGWFAYRVTHDGTAKAFPPPLFYTFVGGLVAVGVALHLVTHETLPWKPLDLNRAHITPDRVFNISVANHRFQLPPERMVIKTGEKALFKVTSGDLTYGFGLFRQDNTMLFQMQVLPGHVNDLLWQFDAPGSYSIRSTEYSGPKGVGMIEKDAVVVVSR